MIEAKDLTKRNGDTLAVDDLSFTVHPGVVTGFLGPEMTGLTSVSRRQAGKFSLGMTQRPGMAAALVIGGVMLVKRAA
jgi:ABC-type multidrug transport system ATPase subunit